MSSRRRQRGAEKTRRHAQPLTVVRQASGVERLAYTRTQAADSLGINRSTFDRRVLPLVETVEMPWGKTLIPVDEPQRLLAEQRRRPRERARPAPLAGRPATVESPVVGRIQAERAAGKSLAAIARELNTDGVPTAHGGRQWWPSTVRAIAGSNRPLPR